jgi:hypothetical protein
MYEKFFKYIIDKVLMFVLPLIFLKTKIYL